MNIFGGNMWIIYQKNDQKIVGMSAFSSGPDLEKNFALKEVVKGLVDHGSPDEYDAIQVTDPEQAFKFITSPPDKLVLEEKNEGMLGLTIQEPNTSFLILQSDAPDVHAVDGIPEIAADGESFTIITVQKVNELGIPKQEKDDNDLLYLRTDYGTLKSVDGKEDISSINLNQGKAAFRLVSEKAKRVATVKIFNADADLIDTSIQIEFI